jgi:hypothetical protein
VVYSVQSSYKDPTHKEIKVARKRRPVIYMLTVFGDESHDPKQQRVFAIAGVIGTQEEWYALEPGWLSRNNGIPFHATDCEAGCGSYKGMSKDDRLCLYRDLVQIVIDTKLMGFGSAIDLGAYNAYFPDNIVDIAYYLCFRNVVMHFAQLAYLHVPQQKVKFIFHQNHKVQHSASALYDCIVNDFTEWKYSLSLHEEIAFVSDKAVGIQLADLLARETFKFVDNRIINTSDNKHPVRKSILALSDTDRFNFEFYGEEYFQSFKAKFEELEQVTGMSRDKYSEWLQSKGLKTDNFPNRVAYLADTVEKERDKSKVF